MGHGIDIVGEIFPFPFHVVYLGLPAQGSIRADLSSNLTDFKRKGIESVNHPVDGALEIKDLSLDIGCDLLGKITLGDRSGDVGDLAHLGGQVVGHAVDIFC